MFTFSKLFRYFLCLVCLGVRHHLSGGAWHEWYQGEVSPYFEVHYVSRKSVLANYYTCQIYLCIKFFIVNGWNICASQLHLQLRYTQLVCFNPLLITGLGS